MTAHGVAILRGIESDKRNGRIYDPYATKLGGEIGTSWLAELAPNRDREALVNGVALRTMVIDDRIAEGLQQDGFRQICVLGAGLDTRPWRLGLTRDSMQISLSLGEGVLWFELDFPEIFEFKLSILEEASARPLCAYRPVAVDLSLPWMDQLIAQGFKKDTPTLWLLEGFTGYLLEEELSRVFSQMQCLSCPCSRLLATFLGPSFPFTNSQYRTFRDADTYL